MIKTLRDEEADDIQHRDRCQAQMNQNGNAISDLEHTKDMTQKELDRLADEEGDLKGKISALEEQIAATKADMEELLEFRNKDSKAFIAALQTDQDAINIIGKAIGFLSKF